MKKLLLTGITAMMLLGLTSCRNAEDNVCLAQDGQPVSCEEKLPGMVGVVFLGPDFKRPKCGHMIDSMDQAFDLKTGFGNDWSAKWHGAIKAPTMACGDRERSFGPDIPASPSDSIDGMWACSKQRPPIANLQPRAADFLQRDFRQVCRRMDRRWF
ncbi:MAG: hypothetical protein HQ515_03890 [Phycisphaeraceae bacterium]|nr:hypothetical protein [Phycisphaeraceae bacterium]